MGVFKIDTTEKFNIFSKDFWIKILIMTIAIWIVSYTSLANVNGGPLYAVLAALIISLLNAFLRPLLSWLSLPLIALSFGIFMLVINALIILLTSSLLSPNFEVSGFWNAFWFSIIVTILTFIMNIPRKIKKLNSDNFNNNNNHQNNNSNGHLFDNEPFNDNPNDNNYTDYEDVN